MGRSARSLGTFLKFNNGEAGTILEGHIVAMSTSTADAVILAKADDLDRMPAIGFVKKVNDSRVIVQVDQVYKWPEAVDPGIDSGKEYWVSSTAGELTDDPSTVPTGSMLQIIGIGKKSPRHILVRVEPMGILT